MKPEERKYLYNKKECEGKSIHQIKLEIERDEHFQELLKKKKEISKKAKKKYQEDKKELNVKFKKAFSKLK